MSLNWALLLSAILCALTVAQGKKFPNIRLPNSILPEHYHVGIVPDIDHDHLEGFVKLDFIVKAPTDTITLHAVNLRLVDSSVAIFSHSANRTKLGQDEPVISNVFNEEQDTLEMIHVYNSTSYDSEKDFVILHLLSELEANKTYRVSFNYSGKLASNLKGIYRSEYFDLKSQSKKWLGVTQFEPTEARSAFPCLDEPAMKATFSISIGRSSKYTSLSNMPIIRTEPMANKENWFWDVYEKSVPMSTYLVACLVSEFAFRPARSIIRTPNDRATSNVTHIRIWAREDAIDQADLAVAVTPKMLEFLEDYFQVPFPLPKVDLVGLPDFSSGAMENWGLITYRETALLVDPKAPSVRSEINVERVIAHELAHQWFGNLVTMDWWNDLWLNEGFATYVQRLVLDNVSPKYEYGTIQSLDFLNVMEADGLKSSHPISVEVAHPTQISEIFDAISYTKGAAIIRMMNDFLGEATFRQGVTNYLKEKEYQNARQDELWHHLSEQARRDSVLPPDVDVKTIMDTWTLQMGYPFVTVERNYSDGSAFIKQTRYLRGTVSTVSNETLDQKQKLPNYLWWVPVSLTNAVTRDFSIENTRPAIWLSPNQVNTTKSIDVDSDSWVIANVRASGFYRVNYDEKNWKLIERQLKSDHRVIHPINRAYLIDDSFAFAAAEILPYTTAFNLIEYLSNEDNHVPWSSALKALNYIGRMFSYTNSHGRYKSFMRSLVIPSYVRYGTDLQRDTSPLTKLLRIMLFNQACSHEYRPCIRQAQSMFDEWMDSPDPLNSNRILPDLRSTVYCTAIKYGGQLEWEFAFKMSFNSSSAQDRDVILSALGCSRDPWILNRYLSFLMDPKSGIRKQDGRRVVSAVASNPGGRRLAFEFILKHFEEMFTYFGAPVRVLQMLSSTTSSLNTEEDLARIKNLMESKSQLLKAVQSSNNNIQTTVSANIKWMANNYDILNQWFASKGF